MTQPVFTIGHSTRDLPTFTTLLHAVEVTLLVDIRTVPRSRTNPQYNKDTLPESLARDQIGYRHLASLGGLRGRSKDIPDATNGFWQNESFHHYADYTLTAAFRTGLQELMALASEQRCAIMCSETVWWRCHRRIVADNLLAHGIPVFHILDADHVNPATLTRGAVVRDDATVVYPPPVPTGTPS